MFDLRALKLFTAFVVVATSVHAQDHSSEQSEAQITGAYQRPFTRTSSLIIFRPERRMHDLFLPARCPEHREFPNDMAACDDPPRKR